MSILNGLFSAVTAVGCYSVKICLQYFTITVCRYHLSPSVDWRIAYSVMFLFICTRSIVAGDSPLGNSLGGGVGFGIILI